MMAYLRYGFAALVAALLITFALANRMMVEVKLLPDTVASLLGIDYRYSLPLFLLVAVAMGAGLLLGFIWEWLREKGLRAEASRLRREQDALRSELERVEKIAPQARKDDVLALVDGK